MTFGDTSIVNNITVSSAKEAKEASDAFLDKHTDAKLRHAVRGVGGARW